MTIIKKYTANGLQLTHPSGAVQVISIAELQLMKNSQEQHKTVMEERITLLQTRITEAQKIA